MCLSIENKQWEALTKCQCCNKPRILQLTLFFWAPQVAGVGKSGQGDPQLLQLTTQLDSPFSAPQCRVGASPPALDQADLGLNPISTMD